jgi:hypothetical protein
VPDGASFCGLKRFSNLFTQINKSKTVGAMLMQCAITSESFFAPFLSLAYCIYGGTPIYINKREEAKRRAAAKYATHRPETIIGWLAAGAEALLNAGAQFINEDWGWETELDKANSAEWDFNRESEQLAFLQTIASDLKEKLLDWSKKDMITIY